MLALPPPTVQPFCTLEVELSPVLDLGLGRTGQRRIIPIVGGTVTGRVSGTILDLGADWQTVLHDDVAELDARYAFRTPDGALVEVVNRGYRYGPPDVMARLASGAPTPPEAYSMRSTARLESGHPDYRWLNRMVFVGTGARHASTVQIDLYSVE
ncbi:DUF3237 domain-containing protein [Cellulomonas phragmiteti]|uniref:UPF0311 protein Cph01nite_10210 n=1 Tax=Cellulomonas phragmiteti TaxID=478780 RepID=A0ABQ4DIT7_9CELL|nr:DUF3237 domain-containing protein [Cellulomonas phragmiteti]GIG39259.1 UPF0311 protein [Cellulomonas phragmiteti]